MNTTLKSPIIYIYKYLVFSKSFKYGELYRKILLIPIPEMLIRKAYSIYLALSVMSELSSNENSDIQNNISSIQSKNETVNNIILGYSLKAVL